MFAVTRNALYKILSIHQTNFSVEEDAPQQRAPSQSCSIILELRFAFHFLQTQNRRWEAGGIHRATDILCDSSNNRN